MERDQALVVISPTNTRIVKAPRLKPNAHMRSSFVASVVVAAQKFVEVEHITLHADPKGESKHAQNVTLEVPTPSPNTATWLSPSVSSIA